jgi:hypothetical protein
LPTKGPILFEQTTYQTLVRPTGLLTHGSECWPLSKDGNVLRIFERRILRMIYGSIYDNGTWRTSYNNEPYMLYNEPDTVMVIKTGRSRWLGHLCKM